MTEPWASLSASSYTYPPLYTPPSEATEIPLHLLYGIDNAGHALPLLSEIETDKRIQSLSPLESPLTRLPSPEGLPIGSPESSARKAAPKMSKRATQNREAQRRFRERREQHNKSLQERGDLLQEKLDALEKRFGDQTEELVKLRGENEGLKKENLELARRWRIISRLLRTPKSSQVLSMFMTADDSSSGLDSDLDACLQCLDALVCPD